MVPHVLCADARALRITAVFECGDPTMMMINKDQQRVSTQLSERLSSRDGTCFSRGFIKKRKTVHDGQVQGRYIHNYVYIGRGWPGRRSQAGPVLPRDSVSRIRRARRRWPRWRRSTHPIRQYIEYGWVNHRRGMRGGPCGGLGRCFVPRRRIWPRPSRAGRRRFGVFDALNADNIVH